MAATPPPFAQYATTPGNNTDVPGSGSMTNADDTLFGVTKALGVVPVAVKTGAPGFEPLPAGSMGPPHYSSTGVLDVRPMEAVLADIDHTPIEQRKQIQSALLRAGYYPSSYYGATPPIVVPGEIDGAFRTAWKSAVEDASRASVYEKGQLTKPVTVAQVISDRITNRQAQGVPAGTTQQAAVTNPATILSALVDAARKVYGHGADESTISQLIGDFQAQEQTYQRSSATTVTKPPDLSTFAERGLQRANPTEAGANTGLEAGDLVMQAFMSTLGHAPVGASGG